MAENNNNNPTETVLVTITEENNNDSKQVQVPNCKKKMSFKSLKMKKIKLLLALITFILSIPLLFEAIWLFCVQQYDCEELLKGLPMLQIAIAIGLILLFFVTNGVVYMYSRARFQAPGLIIVMLPLIVMFILGLSLKGSFKTETRTIAASPRLLEMKVHNKNNWNNIKSCLYDRMICMDFMFRSYSLKPYDFTTSKFSPLESGCCKPPSVCEMEYVNATYWRKSNREMDIDIPYDEDCDLWQNDKSMLCYDCHACKAGFIKTLEGKWLKIGNFLIAVSVLLMLFHLILFVATMWEQYRG